MGLYKQSGSVRMLAVQVLVRVLEKKHKADVVLEQLGVNLEPRDRGLLHELVLGVLRRFYSLEADFSRFLKQKPDSEARMTLLIGTYQLRHMRVPSHAAVSECVNVMKLLQPKASGMINAVLRKVADSEQPSKLKPYQRAELPKWIYAIWRDAWGAEVVQSFCASLQVQPRLCVAVFMDRDTWLKQVHAMGLEAEKGEFSSYAVLLPTGTDVPSLPGFEEGFFTVIDQAAQMAVLALDVPDQGTILDLCAAPGGKTSLLNHRFSNADVLAVEFNAKRMPRLKENLKRLNAGDVNILQANALNLPLSDACVDGIVLDAPCSASGILRRHPDAKFLHDKDTVDALAAVQRNMLKEAMRVLKVGGKLVYAVCSIHPQENEHVLEGYSIEQRRLYPCDSHDGFFWANVTKL
ncbi:MAG: transcription antitermination factor NusB [Mariprofundaceae bacterium]|nr:transcription antitermination factor NusB [Mariprofundaceae bacterium]